MSDEQHIWEKQEGEPLIWFQRFTRYRLMFPTRSVAAVFHEENSKKLEKTRKNDAPDGTWYEKARQWQWQERAEAWDTSQNAEEEEARKRINTSGLALAHRRILLLNKTLDGLLEMLTDKDKVWIPDVKAIGNGPDAERVDLVKFNDALYREAREYIKAIAEEVGDRVKKKEIHIKSLPPNVYLGFDPDQDGIDRDEGSESDETMNHDV